MVGQPFAGVMLGVEVSGAWGGINAHLQWTQLVKFVFVSKRVATTHPPQTTPQGKMRGKNCSQPLSENIVFLQLSLGGN